MMAVAGITLALALRCAPTVAPDTLARMVRVESGGDPLALNVNGLGAAAQPEAKTAAGAAELAARYLAKGYSVDMGLMQVNSGNLARLGYRIAAMFQPCANLAAGAAILTKDYVSAKATRPDPQRALRAALSAYNTGNFRRGFRNGYVQRYLRGPATIVLPRGTEPVAPARAIGAEGPVVLIRRPVSLDLKAPGQPAAGPDPGAAATSVIADWRGTN